MIYKIELTEMASELLGEILDRRIQAKIVERIAALAQDPEKQGKSLGDELDGYRSVRAVGQRYRIIYRIEGDKVLVVVVAVGIRKEGDKKDIYRLAQRLIRLGLLGNEPSAEAESPEETDEEQPENNTTPQ